MHPTFNDGASIMWLAGNIVQYGVVVDGTDASIDVVPVLGLGVDIKCYDEGGSVRRRDKDNVRLKDCPPPFSELCSMAARKGCFAMASTNAKFTFSTIEMERQAVSFAQDGQRISDRDMADILDHLWRDEKEKGVPAMTPDMSKWSPKMAALMRKQNGMRSGLRNDGPDGPEL